MAKSSNITNDCAAAFTCFKQWKSHNTLLCYFYSTEVFSFIVFEESDLRNVWTYYWSKVLKECSIVFCGSPVKMTEFVDTEFAMPWDSMRTICLSFFFLNFVHFSFATVHLNFRTLAIDNIIKSLISYNYPLGNTLLCLPMYFFMLI